jgi:predicted phosphate transport protein (TIGR00153 family)
MESIESWMRSRKQVQVISMIREHSKGTVMAIEQLQRCVDYANKGKIEEMKRAFTVLSRKEKEDDDLKRRIIAELAKGDLPSKEREDLMRLAKENDQVISWINETSRILVEFNFREMSEGIKNIVDDMIKVIYACVVKLDECISKLMDKEFQDALKAANEVENLEEEMDTLYQRGRVLIFALDKSNIGIGSAILLTQFIEGLENIADRCEDTADEVRVMAVVFSS